MESAINSTQVEVTFNQEIKSVKPADFTVTEKTSGNYAFVTKAEVKSTDKKVVVLTFANPLTDKATYNVKADGVVTTTDKTVSNSTSEFTYVKANVASVEFTSTTIQTGTNIKDNVKVLDALGRDITKEVELEVQTSDASVIDANGLAQKAGNVVVKVAVKGTSVATANTAIAVTDSAAKTFVGYHLAKAADAPANTDAFKKLDSKDVVTSVTLGDNTKVLNLYYLDQFGKSINVVNGTNATYTSLNPNVLVVDKNGTVIPVSVGTGAVKVKVGNVETTLLIEVKAASAVAAMNTDKNSISAAVGAVSPTFKVSFVDQYGKDIAVDTQFLKVKSSDESVATAVTGTSGSASSVTYTVNALKEGSATLTVTYDDGTKKFEKTIPVTVTKAGNIAGYQVVPSTTALDVAADTTTDENDAKSATIEVYAVDAAGNRLAKLDASKDVTVSFVDEAATNAVKNQLSLNDVTVK